MPIITISRHQSNDEIVFAIEDFESYVGALIQAGIEAPKAKYRIAIPRAIADEMRVSNIDIDEQGALFFRLGTSSGLAYDIADKP